MMQGCGGGNGRKEGKEWMEMRAASAGRRMVGFVIDMVVIQIVLWVVGVVLSGLAFASSGEGCASDPQAFLSLAWTMAACNAFAYTVVWSLRDVALGPGRSLGKRLLGMKAYGLTPEGGLEEMGPAHSFLRNLPVIAYFVFGVLYGPYISYVDPGTGRIAVDMEAAWVMPLVSAAFIVYLLVEAAAMYMWGRRIGDYLGDTIVVDVAAGGSGRASGDSVGGGSGGASAVHGESPAA